MRRRSYFGVFTMLVAMALLYALAGSSGAAPGDTTRVSVDSSGAEANRGSSFPSISADGRFVAFASTSSNLVAGDTNQEPNDDTGSDIFVRDRDADEDGILDEADEPGATKTERVSISSSGDESNGFSSATSLSADGRFVAFHSWSTNLVDGDTNNASDIFVHDRQTGTTERVSVDSSENEANNFSYFPSISADGRYVAFESRATNLGAGSDTLAKDIFVRDLQAGTTERVSVGSGNWESFGSAVSADGRYVAFFSGSPTLVPGDTNDKVDVFVRDLVNETTQRVSVAGSGTEANGSSARATISSDGLYVAFGSDASNLVPLATDTNGASDIFVHERGNTTPQSDCIAPTSTASAITSSDLEYTSDTWTNEDVKVTLSAQDNEGGSGIKNVRYSATGAQSIPQTVYDPHNPPIITTEGTTKVSYFATDNAGNRESLAKTFMVKIDRSAPNSSATARDSAGNSYTSGTWTATNATLALSANDGSGSGIKEITYSINGGVNQTYNPTEKIIVSSEGMSTISYVATDKAGNQESPEKSFTVKIDRSAPMLDIDNSDGSDGITPDKGLTGVIRNIKPTATFSDEMEPASLGISVKLYRWNALKKIWQPVPTAVSVEGKTATLDPYPADPTRLLAANKKYKVTVTTGAKNLAGLPMSSNKSWTFTIGGASGEAMNGKIAFSSNRGGNYDIYTVDPDGSSLSRLTNTVYAGYQPVWSPDGTKIALQESGGISIMGADGSNLRNLTTNRGEFFDFGPTWSPDGTQLAFGSSGPPNQTSEIYTMGADGSNQINLTNSPEVDELYPDFSPNGSQMCLYRSDGKPGTGIYIMNADGSNPTRLTDRLSAVECDWSPDGKKIAYTYQVLSGGVWRQEVYVMNADGSGKTNLTSNPARDLNPGWSPDGTKITFSSDRDGDFEVYTMDPDGSNVAQVTTNSGVDDVDPDWQSLP